MPPERVAAELEREAVGWRRAFGRQRRPPRLQPIPNQTLHASPCEAVSHRGPNKYLICQRKGVTQKPQTKVFYTLWLIQSLSHT